MSKSYERKIEKMNLYGLLMELGVAIPDNARINVLRKLLDEYYSEAVVVNTPDGVGFRRTDKPVKTYNLTCLIETNIAIEAESEKAAIEWITENLCCTAPHDSFRFNFFDIEVTSVHSEDEE